MGNTAVVHDRVVSVERAYRRHERRTCAIMGGANSILDEFAPDRRWSGLTCAVCVVAEHTARSCTTRSVHCFSTNLPVGGRSGSDRPTGVRPLAH